MMRTKSIYGPVEREDGLRILITRWYPRGVKRSKYDIWMRELSPSADLLKRYKNSEIGWEDFVSCLLLEMQNNMDAIEAIESLHVQSRTRDMTLLCHEKEGCPCHRHVVRDLVRDPKRLQSGLV